MISSWSPVHNNVHQCSLDGICTQWPTYHKWRVPGSWSALDNFVSTADLKRTEFDRKYVRKSTIRRMDSYQWISDSPLYAAGDAEYVDRCSRKLLQLRGQRVLFIGDSTTDRVIKALAYAYEEVYSENPFDTKIDYKVQYPAVANITTGSVQVFHYRHINASILYFPSAFLTHPSIDAFKPLTKLWASRLPPPAKRKDTHYRGDYNHSAVFTGTPAECPNCWVLPGILKDHAINVVVVNGGAWFNDNKLRRINPWMAFHIAMTAFWDWAHRSEAPVIWYWRTTNTGHFKRGKCLEKAPSAKPVIDRVLSIHNRDLNKLSLRILQPHLEHMHIRLLDSGNVMYHRHDAHCGYRLSRIKVRYYDCLHYCWPGPWRWVNYIFLKSLASGHSCDFCEPGPTALASLPK